MFVTWEIILAEEGMFYAYDFFILAEDVSLLKQLLFVLELDCIVLDTLKNAIDLKLLGVS